MPEVAPLTPNRTHQNGLQEGRANQIIPTTLRQRVENNSLPVFSSKTGTEPGQIISLDDLLQAILDAAPKEKKMYFFKPIPGVDYRAPKLSRGDAGWFVFYYVKDPGTGRLRRIRVKINHVKPTRERERVAREMIAALGERLALGWNPLRDAGAPRSGVGVFDAYAAFLAAKKKEAEIQSVASYRSYVKVFSEWLQENGFSKDRPIGCVSHETAVAFMEYLDTKEGISPRTWNNYLSFLMTLHAWLIARGYIAVNPALTAADNGAMMTTLTLVNRTLGYVNAPVIGQRLAAAICDTTVDLDIYKRRHDLMAKVLKDAGIEFTMPRGAFYFFPKAPGGDDAKFVDALLEEKILAVPGSGFGRAGYIRLSCAVDEKIIARSAEGFKRAKEKCQK